MPRFKFEGSEPHWVPALGVDVSPGEIVEVEDEQVAAGLVGQPAWKPTDTSAKKVAKEAEVATSGEQG